MEGKIDSFGNLYIMRGGAFVMQLCPHKFAVCSHSCPLMGEPMPSDEERLTKLSLCQDRVLFFSKFTDERGETEAKEPTS